MTDLTEPQLLRITCAPGLIDYLRREVEELGYTVDSARPMGLELTADLRDAMRLNLFLRTAFNVLALIDGFTCCDPNELYERVRDLPWEEMIAPDEYLSVVSSVNTPTITDWRFASLKVKDAIVDRVAAATGARPNSGPERENFVVHLYWNGDDAQLFLNTSGRKLADRNYRKLPHKAPMQETLAAGVILATGYDGSVPFVNPMCGSGTLAIEAALIASGRPPGLLRSNFGFMHCKGFDADAWQALRREAKKIRNPGPIAPIIATDIDERAIRAAKKNAETAGVHHMIEFDVCDFAGHPHAAGKRGSSSSTPSMASASASWRNSKRPTNAWGTSSSKAAPLDRVHLHGQPRSGQEGRPARQPADGVLQREDRLPLAQV